MNAIELTDQQIRALDESGGVRPRFVNPRTNEAFTLLRIDEFERLTRTEYDDSPWTRDELESVAWDRLGSSDEEWTDRVSS